MNESADRERTPGRAGGLGRLLLLGCAAGLGALAAALYRAPAREERTDAPTTEVRDTPAVVLAVRDLARLETAAYHLERVIDMRDQQPHLFGLFRSEDAVLLVAAADVVAGIDLTLLDASDVRVDRALRRVELTLPAPTILSARLDNERTYVHSRSTDALAMPARTLETRARLEAERSLREAALESGILERARVHGARTLETLMRSLGFEQVVIEFRDSELSPLPRGMP